MEVIVGKTSGFCFGVKNAVEKTKEILQKEDNVYCLGELINNNQVMSDLKQIGLIVISDIEEVADESTVIIRAHGVVPEVYKKAEDKKIRLIDLTCPKIKKIHKIAEEYSKKGYFIGITATRNHPEAIGTKGFAGKKSYIIQELEDVEEFLDLVKNERDILIISQTTFSTSKFKMIIERCNFSSVPKLHILNTICGTTKARQEEAAEISKKVDLMVVIGGRESSNTKKLYEVSKENCDTVIMIETKDEIDLEAVKNFNKIGIIAGASTPQNVIDEVISIWK